MAVIWVFAGLAGLIWSLFCWFLWAAAGAGSSAALGLAKLLQIDPLRVVWLAETLDSVGGVAQVLVVIFWLVGMGILLLLASLAARAGRIGRDAMTEARIAAGDPSAGRSPAVEGEVRARVVQRPPDLPGG